MPDSSEALSFLASLTVRSLVLFAAAGAALFVCRVKSAAARHAVWTVVAGGMLALAALGPMLPELPLRILRAVETTPAPLPEVAAPAPGAPLSQPASAPFRSVLPTWRDGAVAVYVAGVVILLGRLLFGLLFTRRLVRAAASIPGRENLYASAWISVPLTVGRKVLLPGDWHTWDAAKLDAVLAHEHTHVQRGDWVIALMAGVNRSVFWFHPLAWWLERCLATLAEQACDDSALLLVESRSYAQVLLDMAAAVRTTQGRLIWEAMAMANAAEVRNRIERILDETRQIPRAVTRARWAAILACGLPMVWLVSVTQLAPAAAQEQPQSPAAIAELLKGRQIAPADAAALERYLAANPHDLPARRQLILYYYSAGIREPRLSHILWIVANHPESGDAMFVSQGITPRDSSFNSLAEYQRVLEAWRQAAAARPNDPEVLLNAAWFFQSVGEMEAAEKLLQSGADLQRGMIRWKDRLGRLYAAAILGATGDPRFPNHRPAFANRVRSQIFMSEDGWLLYVTGSVLRSSAMRPTPGKPLPPGTLNLDDHPLLLSATDFGQQLIERAAQFGGPREVVGTPGPSGGVLGGIVGSAPAGGVKGGVPGGIVGSTPVTGVPGGVLGGIIGSAPAGGPIPPPPELPAAPSPLRKVEPLYPPLALQARIQGVVKLQGRIGTDGAIKNLQVVSGHPLLVPAALEAVKQWTYAPQASEQLWAIEAQFNLPPGDVKAPAEARPLAPRRILVGSNVQAFKLIRRVEPTYPAQGRAEGIQGDVKLQIVIDESGRVVQADPIEGNPILASAAREAVLQWVYQTTLLNGQPVEVGTTVVVPFQLQ